VGALPAVVAPPKEVPMRAPFIPRIPGDAFGREPRGYEGLRRLAARYARDELSGRTLANHATQLAVTLTPEALAAATRPGAPAALLRAIAELPSLLAHALYVRTVTDQQRRPEVRRLQLLAASAEVAGRPVKLLFVLRENFNGQCFLDRVIERASPKRSPGFAQAGAPERRRQDGGVAPYDATHPPWGPLSPASDSRAPDQGTADYSPSREGWHDYTEGPNLVCPAALACSPGEIADQLSRYAIPGQDAAVPAENGKIYPVLDPWTGMYAGNVRTNMTADGLTVTNTTLPGHVFYNGQIMRTATQGPDGAWYVTTHGFGNNVEPGANDVNQYVGPEVFRTVDAQMRANIELHHRGRGAN
jgi:hypothetical protein